MTISQKQLEEMRNADPDSIMGMANNLFELINKHQEGNTLSSLTEVEDVAEDVLTMLGLVGAKYYAKGKR